MTKLSGWIIYNGQLKSDKFLDYVTWFKQSAEKANIHLEILTNDEILVSNDKTKPLLFSKTRCENFHPDFVHYADKDLHLARQLESMNIPLFNRSKSIEICDNKSLMHHHLVEKSIPTPMTIIAPMTFNGIEVKEVTYIERIIEAIGLPMIIKEAFGSFGQQVYWIDSKEQLEIMTKKLAGKDHLYQKPVHHSLGKDIRINVVGGKVVASMKRTSQTDFRANVTAGGSTTPYDPSLEEKTLAVQAAAAVGADFAGVDLLLEKEGPVVCEVNSNPHIRSIYECTGIDVAIPMIEHIDAILSGQKERKLS
ncbi:ATP-grasp domain-containing protein [Salipaludibacillus sp. CF4.18]|uniref:ATP-grasp domain-containing protein n=1 Tax=Salipaludibacillus sp. CF4.18 TaxID=3373081 RepID=UPI003EE63663